MSYQDTTVKRELILLNEDVERLLERTTHSSSVSEDALDEIKALHETLLDSIDTSRSVSAEALYEMRANFVGLENAISESSKKLSDAVSGLGGSIVGAAVVGGLFAVGAAAIVGAFNSAANDPDNVWEKKIRRCLATAKALRDDDGGITFEMLKNRLLLNGMSQHDSEYTIRACVDRNLIKQVTNDGQDDLLVIGEPELHQALESRNETSMSPTQRILKLQLAGIMDTLSISHHSQCHPEIGEALNAIRVALRATLSDEDGVAFENIVPPVKVDMSKTRGDYSLSREAAVRLCKQLQAYVKES